VSEAEGNPIAAQIKKLIHHRYGDVILLFAVIAAFGVLLAFSAI